MAKHFDMKYQFFCLPNISEAICSAEAREVLQGWVLQQHIQSGGVVPRMCVLTAALQVAVTS